MCRWLLLAVISKASTAPRTTGGVIIAGPIRAVVFVWCSNAAVQRAYKGGRGAMTGVASGLIVAAEPTLKRVIAIMVGIGIGIMAGVGITVAVAAAFRPSTASRV